MKYLNVLLFESSIILATFRSFYHEISITEEVHLSESIKGQTVNITGVHVIEVHDSLAYDFSFK